MIQDSKLITRLINIMDDAYEVGLLTEVIVTAMEEALTKGYDKSKESMDQRIVNLFEIAAREWDIGLWNGPLKTVVMNTIKGKEKGT